MARPKSEDKRIALLEAAKIAVAEHGLGAATSLIAKNAGVAEGTLFRYFATKDELFNGLYLYLKTSLGVTMMKDFRVDASAKERARIVWSGFIDWGLVHPQASKAMRQLAVSDRITQQTKDRVASIHPELRRLAEDCITNEFLSCGLSSFADAIFYALAETTAEFASREPEKAQEYKASGFEAMWRAMSRD